MATDQSPDIEKISSVAYLQAAYANQAPITLSGLQWSVSKYLTWSTRIPDEPDKAVRTHNFELEMVSNHAPLTAGSISLWMQVEEAM